MPLAAPFQLSAWGHLMKRPSIASTLNLMITLMAVSIVLMLARQSWHSWERLTETKRMTVISDLSADAFQAMHN